jgi:hypothetical protein
MTQYITYQTDQKRIGLGTEVQLTGKVVEIAGDKSYITTLKIEVTEFQKLYGKEI